MDYLTFDLTISHRTPAGYPLRADSRLGQAPAAGRPEPLLALDPAAEPLASLLSDVARGRAEQSGLAALGRLLAQALFVGEIGDLFQTVRGAAAGQEGRGVRLRLRVGPSELAALPWELLWLPGDPDPLCVSTNSVVTRFLDADTPVRDMPAPKPVRILAVMPTSAGIDTHGHKTALDAAVAAAGGALELHWLEGAVTREHVRAALGQAETHVLHFIGHGAFNAGQPSLQLNDDHGDPFGVSAAAFAGFFRNRASMRLVVLNACRGAAADSANALLSAAPLIAAQGVPAVAAMQWDIYDWAARDFAAAFYGALCAGPEAGEVDTALTRARATLYDDSPDSRSFATPVLLLRAEAGRLWDAVAPGQPAESGAESTQIGGIRFGDRAHVAGDVFTGPKQVINTGGGQFFAGPVEVGGDFVGGNKTVTQSAGGDIVGRDKITRGGSPSAPQGSPGSPGALEQRFAAIHQAIAAWPADPRVDKDELARALRRVEVEALKGTDANLARMEDWLAWLADTARDIYDLAAAALTQPGQGLPQPLVDAARRAGLPR